MDEIVGTTHIYMYMQIPKDYNWYPIRFQERRVKQIGKRKKIEQYAKLSDLQQAIMDF